jgi:eukaryotic-like serine/threonine-protein kinase
LSTGEVEVTPGGVGAVRATSLWPGSMLAGRYRISGRIAGGSMGQVYRGVQLPAGRDVAIKVLSTDPGVDSTRFRKRFRREAEAVSRLSHPNIVTVIDYGETDRGEPFMAMEYLAGRPLSEIMYHSGQLPLERALSITIQITRGLRKAHALGVMHRDLKPANIVLVPDQDGGDLVKVLDFGLVKLFAPEESEVEGVFTDEALTAAGSLMGTPGYMSPEQGIGEASDGRADLYAVGVLLYQMLTGRMPFIAESLVELVKEQVFTPVPPIAEVAPEVSCPPELEAIIRRCLHRNKQERYQTASELLAQLKSIWRLVADDSFGTETFPIPDLPEVIAAISDPTPKPTLVVEPRAGPMSAPATLVLEPQKRSRWPMVLAAAALLGGVAIYLALQRPPPSRPPPTAVKVESYKENPY